MSHIQRLEARKGRAAGQCAPRTLNMEVLQCGFDVLTALTIKMIVLTRNAEEVHRYTHQTAWCHAKACYKLQCNVLFVRTSPFFI
jgi:hypothetical protein